TIQTSVRGGMAPADVHPPTVAADVDHIAGGHRDRLWWQRRDTSVDVAAPGHRLQIIAGQAMTGEETTQAVVHFLIAGPMQVMGERPFAVGHPYRRLEPIGEPAGLAYVVWMIMRHQDAADRSALQAMFERQAPEL